MVGGFASAPTIPGLEWSSRGKSEGHMATTIVTSRFTIKDVPYLAMTDGHTQLVVKNYGHGEATFYVSPTDAVKDDPGATSQVEINEAFQNNDFMCDEDGWVMQEHFAPALTWAEPMTYWHLVHNFIRNQ